MSSGSNGLAMTTDFAAQPLGQGLLNILGNRDHALRKGKCDIGQPRHAPARAPMCDRLAARKPPRGHPACDHAAVIGMNERKIVFAQEQREPWRDHENLQHSRTGPPRPVRDTADRRAGMSVRVAAAIAGAAHPDERWQPAKIRDCGSSAINNAAETWLPPIVSPTNGKATRMLMR